MSNPKCFILKEGRKLSKCDWVYIKFGFVECSSGVIMLRYNKASFSISSFFISYYPFMINSLIK